MDSSFNLIYFILNDIKEIIIFYNSKIILFFEKIHLYTKNIYIIFHIK